MDIWQIAGYMVFIFFTFIIVCGISAIWPSIIGAPWVPTPMKTVRKMLEMAKVTPEDTLIDLGSGDGRIIVMAAKEFGANAIGIEVDPLRVLWSRFVIWRNGLRNKVKVIWSNFFNQNLEDATVVSIYQLQEVNNKLKTKFTSELKPGTRLISYSFTFDDWSPIESNKKPNLYLYKI